MKKKKVKIPIYGGTLIIILNGKWEKINKKYDIKLTKEFDAAVFKHFLKSGYTEYIAVFKKKPPVPVIAHEAVHIVNHIFIDRMMEVDRYNDEPQAYLMGWVVNQIESFINKK